MSLVEIKNPCTRVAALGGNWAAIGSVVDRSYKEVFRELSIEFAVEAQKLLGVSLEGSVG